MRFQKLGRVLLVGVVLAFCVSAWSGWVRPSLAQATPKLQASELVQQGVDRYSAGEWAAAIELWESALKREVDPDSERVIRGNLAQAYRQVGQQERALQQWQRLLELAEDSGDRADKVAATIERAQVYGELGQHRRARAELAKAETVANSNALRPQTRMALHGAMGNTLAALGEYDDAIAAYRQSLDIAETGGDRAATASTLNNLGNTYRSRAERLRFQLQAAEVEGDEVEVRRLAPLAEADDKATLASLERSVRVAQSVNAWAEVRSRLNFIRLFKQNQPTDAEILATHRDRVRNLLAELSDSTEKAYSEIAFAVSLPASDRADAQAWLTDALRVANEIGDRRAASFAMGSLGELYEVNQQYDAAMQWTRQATFASQAVAAPDSLYRWQWQSGRILVAMGDSDQAKTAYRDAISTLQSIRGDIVAVNQELQFTFRDAVEPVYRQAIGLLLAESEPSQATLQEVLDTLELLKLAELQNFFGDECVEVAKAQAAAQKPAETTAVAIYSVILPNRTEMIARSPDGTLTAYPVEIGAAKLAEEIRDLRFLLEKRATDQYLPQAQKLYDLLLRPLESDLKALNPKTLAFIHDGVLRQVPMAALHDGDRFLIETYPMAVTPSLSLTSGQPLQREDLRALIVGLTVERSPFEALANVEIETKNVRDIVSGARLLDEAFTLDTIQNELSGQNYPIVHMATHGKFGVDAASTFLLAFDNRLSIERVDSILRSRPTADPIELLTLSACQTAAGDNRSTLGMAGVAVRAGAKSALATLWFINDESTAPLIAEFYNQLLDPGTTKAEALRRAQLKFITDADFRDFSHPAVWSPFILIGNWL
ncbi:MAG: CHAT domain-containing protein [Cyanobacteria bacterium P01_F01_bin.33]